MLWRVSALKYSVFQKTYFSRFSINQTCCLIDRNCDKNFGLTKKNFHASFVFRIHMHYIVFIFILQFCSHISYCFRTSHAYTLLHWVLNLIKNWLINFWAMYFLVYAFFMCEPYKIFFLKDMMDNQCANIFSTHTTVYGSHSVMFAFYWKR